VRTVTTGDIKDQGSDVEGSRSSTETFEVAQTTQALMTESSEPISAESHERQKPRDDHRAAIKRPVSDIFRQA